MIQIRKGLFETNSSSTHSLVMCSSKDLADYMDGKTVLDIYEHSFTPIEEVTEYDLHLDENRRPVLNGVTYKDVEDLFYENIDEDYPWMEGRDVPWWMLDAFGGFYSCDTGEMNGVAAIAIEYNNEI